MVPEAEGQAEEGDDEEHVAPHEAFGLGILIHEASCLGPAEIS